MTAVITKIELKSGDLARTAAFYADVFAWTSQQDGRALRLEPPSGPELDCVLLDAVQAAAPIPYISVDDLAAVVAKLRSVGARVLLDASASPEPRAIFADLDGNVLGLRGGTSSARKKPEPSPTAAAAKKPEPSPTAATTKTAKPKEKKPTVKKSRR